MIHLPHAVRLAPLVLLLAVAARAGDPPASAAPAAAEAHSPAPPRFKFKSGRFWHVPRLPVPPRR
ncbi:MAG: hypothetical protein R3F56_13530 [Planctomycetota bacterium]